jgi:hypothetical protein
MNSELLSSVLLGICLSAACGLRAFLPALAFAAAVAAGCVIPGSGFGWIGSPAGVILIGLAAIAEASAYGTARADRFLETAATPAAMLVGSLLAMASLRDVGVLTGTLVPIVIGVTVAGISQSLAALARSRAVPARGRLFRSAAETGGSMALSAVGVAFPSAGGILAIAILAAQWKDVRAAVLR